MKQIENTDNILFVLLSVKIKVQDFSFYCIFRKRPNFYGNGVCNNYYY